MGSSRLLPLTSDVGWLLSAALGVPVAAAGALAFLLQNEVPDIVQETGIKTILIEKKCKMAVWGGLTNSCEKKRSEKQRRKGKIKASECRVSKNSKER